MRPASTARWALVWATVPALGAVAAEAALIVSRLGAPPRERGPRREEWMGTASLVALQVVVPVALALLVALG